MSVFSSSINPFTQYIEAFLIYFEKKLSGATNVSRVTSVTLTKPTTVVQNFKQFDIMFRYAYGTGVISDQYLLFLLHIWCTFFNGFTDSCYNNVFADIALNGGTPNANTISSVVDVYSWSGWLKMYFFSVILNGIVYSIIYLFGAVGYAFYYSTANSALCKAGDLVLFGWDLCPSLSWLTVTNA